MEDSDRKQIEEALRESEERFRAVFENAAIGISLVSPDGWLLDFNPAMCRMLGYEPWELRNVHVADFTHPDDLAAELGLLEELVAGKRDHFQMEKRYIRKGGGILWGRLTSSLVRTGEGTAVFTVGMIEDITERKHSEKALQESEGRYRELADSLPETVFEMDAAGILTFVNRAGFEKFGYSREDLERGLSVIDHLAPEDVVRAARDIATRIKGGGVGRQEYTAIRRDGSTFPVVIYSSRIVRNGQPVGLRGFLVDVSEQKRTEEAVRESDARFRTIFERAAIGVGLTDEDGWFIECNLALQVMLGYSLEELCHRRIADVTHPEDVDVVTELYQQLMSGSRDQYQVEQRFVRKDGQSVWTRVTVSSFLGEGRPRYAIGMVEDTSRRKELEKQLLRAQRLETAGRIAGQVAHDFNNLLGPVIAYPDLIRMELPDGHPALQYCDLMQDAAERMAQINENLMALGRRGVLDEQPIDLNQLLEQTIRQMEPVPEKLAVELNLAPELMPVSGSPAQLSRVVTNLVANAREAMQDVGALSVTTQSVRLDKPLIGYSRVGAGEYVRLDVGDTGCGIPLEIRDKIFDAFFTTKHSGRKRGSGLGLSIVQSVVEDHRGGIDFSSEVGRGTVFSVYLPVSRDHKRTPSADGLLGGTERVLVVDDDQIQQEVTRELLCRLGYRVQVASSGEEGLEFLQDHQVDLLILDMVMPPGIDGAETYRRVLKMRPGQRTIFVSGFAESERVRQAQALGAGAYLRKPVKLETLARAVRETLAQVAL